jgi:hypothetical protein
VRSSKAAVDMTSSLWTNLLVCFFMYRSMGTLRSCNCSQICAALVSSKGPWVVSVVRSPQAVLSTVVQREKGEAKVPVRHRTHPSIVQEGRQKASARLSSLRRKLVIRVSCEDSSTVARALTAVEESLHCLPTDARDRRIFCSSQARGIAHDLQGHRSSGWQSVALARQHAPLRESCRWPHLVLELSPVTTASSEAEKLGGAGHMQPAHIVRQYTHVRHLFLGAGSTPALPSTRRRRHGTSERDRTVSLSAGRSASLRLCDTQVHRPFDKEKWRDVQ